MESKGPGIFPALPFRQGRRLWDRAESPLLLGAGTVAQSSPLHAVPPPLYNRQAAPGKGGLPKTREAAAAVTRDNLDAVPSSSFRRPIKVVEKYPSVNRYETNRFSILPFVAGKGLLRGCRY